MGLTVEVNYPQFPKGKNMDIRGIGLVENGGSKDLTDEEEAAFVMHHGQMVREAFEGSETVKVTGSTTIKGGIESVLPSDVSDTAPSTTAMMESFGSPETADDSAEGGES